MLRYKCKSGSRRGFSLTEMSVVLAAVAAVVVVTIGGSAIVQRTRLGSVLSDIKVFNKAVTAFEAKHNAIPGDYAGAWVDSTHSIWGDGCGATASVCNGNANGSIDSDQESLKFWQHLSLGGFIQGKYDGVSTYVPETGIPAGSIKASGYKVIDPTSISLPSQAMVIEFAGFNASSNSEAILTPDDAKSIDQKIDDGKPNTGSVMAVGSGTDCATGTASSDTYNVSSKNVGCRLRFIIRQSAQASDSVTLSGTCQQAGLTRSSEDTADVCPTGTIGKVMKTCRFNSANVGSWVLSENHCVPVTCFGQKKYGDRRTVSCMSGQSGAGTAQTCSTEGVWVTDSVDCSWTHDTSSCTTGTEIRAPQACNWGQTGSVTQTCTGSVWVDSDTCATIECSATPNAKVGDTRNYTAGCGTNYSGTATELCSMDGNWKVTSNKCVPNLYTATNCVTPYVSPTVGTQDIDIGCPPGETGNHWQRCVTAGSPGTWITSLNTCEPIRCSGERVGTARVVKDGVCPAGRNGVVIEVCESDGGTPPKGVWTANYTHCATTMCDGSKDRAGYAIWPYAAAGTNSVSGTCIPGYTGSPTRNCGAESSGVASWSSVTGACTRIQCAALTSDNATWPLTDSLTQDVSGTCVWPNYEGMPVRDCDSTGAWATGKSFCSLSVLPVRGSVLKLWLDAADKTALFTGGDCASGSLPSDSASIGCWKDKSGYANNATQGTSASQPVFLANIQNGKPAIRFDGTNDYLALPNNIIADGDIPYSVFTVVNSSDITGSPGILNLGNFTDNQSLIFRFDAAGTAISDWGSSSLAASSVVVSTPYIFSFTYDTAAGRATYINGTSSATSATIARSGVNAGMGYVGRTAAYMKGDIDEIIVYNSTLSDSQRRDVEYYLGKKWGVVVAAPSAPILWLDANDPTTVLTASDCSAGTPSYQGAVGCWKNKGSNSSTDNFIQATGGNQPIYKLGGVGSNSGITFNGSNSYMYLNTASELNFSGSGASALYTLFATFKNTHDGGAHAIFSKFNIGVSGIFRMWDDGNYFYTDRYSTPGSLASIKLATSDAHVLTARYDGTSLYQYLDGALQSSSAFDPLASDTTTKPLIGAQYSASTPTNFLNGDIYEILAYDTALSTTDRAAVENYLMNKWDIALPLPTGVQLWLDADDSSSLFTNTNCSSGGSPGDGASIACWADKSRNGNNMISGSNPTYSLASINGKNSVFFNSSNSFLSSTHVNGFASENSSTAFFVARTAGAVSADATLLEGGDADSSSGMCYTAMGQLGFLHRSPWGSSGGDNAYSTANSLSYNNTFLVSAIRDGSAGTQTAWTNGTSGSVLTSLAAPAQPAGTMIFTLGRDGSKANGAGYNLNGNIGEVILYNRALSSTERVSIENYLKSKWSINSLPYTGNLKLWLDGADLDSMFANSDCSTDPNPASGVSVACWKDKSGNGSNATMGYSPIVQYNALNGRPVLRFGGNNYLTGTIPSLVGNVSSSIFLVGKYNTTNMSQIMFSIGTGRYTSYGFYNNDGGVFDLYNWAGLESVYTPSDTNYNLFTLLRSNTTNTHTLYVNRAQSTSTIRSGTPLNINSTYYIGCGTESGSSLCMTGDIAEAIVYDAQLSAANRQKVEVYLKDKWATP